MNFLALLGWNPGDDTEMMSMQELIDKFSIEHCSRAGAKFAYEKGRWFNHEYLLKLPDDKLAELFKPVLADKLGVNPADFSDEYITKAVSMVKSRINFVSDLAAQARFFFVAPEEYEPKAVKKRWSAETPAILTAMLDKIDSLGTVESKPTEEAVLGWIADNGYHLGNVMNALRLAVVGECKGPHMFDIIELMGLDETRRRVNRAIETIHLPEQ